MKKEPKLLISMIIGCGVLVALGTVLNSRRTPAPKPATPVSASLSADPRTDSILKKNAEIKKYLEERAAKANSATAPLKLNAEQKAVLTLMQLARCQTDSQVCGGKVVSPADMRQAFESVEAQVRLNGLKDEATAAAVLTDIIYQLPAYAVPSVQLLQEFENAEPLLALYDLSSLRADVKVSLIEASLDPADESLKTQLREKSKSLLESMLQSGSPADAFQAISALKLFPDMPDTELAKMGQSLCRIKERSENNEVENFKYEALKLRLQRSVNNRKQLKILTSGCDA